MINSKWMMALSLSMFLTACGGGGSSSSGSSSGGGDLNNNTTIQAPDYSEQPSPDGIYLGSGSDATGALEFLALVYDYKLYAIDDNKIQYNGEIISYPTTDEFGMSVKMYDTSLDLYNTAMVEGTYAPAGYIDGDWEGVIGGGTGSFSLDYAGSAYEKSASIATISGTWADTNLQTPPTITIDSDGGFFGTGADGCTFTGTFTVPQSDRNTYKINMIVENCSSYNGTYSGLAALIGDTDPGLFVFAASSFYSWPFTFEKQ